MSKVLYPYPGATEAGAYEQLNQCSDPDQKIEACLERIAPWKGRVLLDIGAGSGFHAVPFARQGFACHHVQTAFRAPDRETLANVFRMDFPHCWQQLLASVTGLEFDYGSAVYHYRATQ